MKKIIFCFTIIIVYLSNSSCVNKNKQTLLGNCDTSNVKYSVFVTQLIQNECISCHNNASASAGVTLEGYNNVSNNASKSLTTIKNGSMPKGKPKLDKCDIAKLEQWINIGKPNN